MAGELLGVDVYIVLAAEINLLLMVAGFISHQPDNPSDKINPQRKSREPGLVYIIRVVLIAQWWAVLLVPTIAVALARLGMWLIIPTKASGDGAKSGGSE